MTDRPSERELELLTDHLTRAERSGAEVRTHTPAAGAEGLGVAALARALHVSRSSIMITDAELDEPGPAILYVNPAFEALTGYSSDEVIGRNPRFLQGPRSDRQVLDRLRQDVTSTGSFEGQTINYRKGGEPFVMSWRISAVRDDAGVADSYVAVQDDRTLAWLDRIRASEAVAALQRTLLPSSTDAIDGVDVATLYRPADGHTEVGGDWYDAVESHGSLHLVVGDVAGHGIGAAADMGKIRFALSCLLRSGMDVTDAMATVRAALQRERAHFATVALATIDPTRCHLEVRTYGHPGVVHLSQGRATVLRSADPLVGIDVVRPEDLVEVSIEPGDLVVLFTDGLVESRTTTVVEGTEQLTAHVERLAAEVRDLDELAHQLVERCLDGRRPTDDLAILIARIA